MDEDDVLSRLRETETKLAVLEQAQQNDRKDIDSLRAGVARGLWILGGGFISSIVAWIAGGGLMGK